MLGVEPYGIGMLWGLARQLLLSSLAMQSEILYLKVRETTRRIGFMRVAVIGAGSVGIVAAACLSSLGHLVVCCDKDDSKIDNLKRGILPIYEPNLDAIFESSCQLGTLSFETSMATALKGAKVVLVAVGTPSAPGSSKVDLTQLNEVICEIIAVAEDEKIVVVKSTVPFGTSARLEELKKKLRPDSKLEFASNPEFLREGNAVMDFMKPDRIVIGVNNEKTRIILEELYAKLDRSYTAMVVTKPISAELIKYTANSYLATRLTFFNQISDLCEATGANFNDLANGVGLDSRIGTHFMRPGPGFGGSCLPKDTNALAVAAREFGCPVTMVEAAIAANESRQASCVTRVENAFGRSLQGSRTAVLGTAFKAETDDIRQSASIKLILDLQIRGVEVSVYDPKAMPRSKEILSNVRWAHSTLDACRESDIVVIMTEWNEFGEIDPAELKGAMSGNVVVDFRNLFIPEKITSVGLNYFPLGLMPSFAL